MQGKITKTEEAKKFFEKSEMFKYMIIHMYISVISIYVFLCVFDNYINKWKFCDLIGRLNLGNVCYHVI